MQKRQLPGTRGLMVLLFWGATGMLAACGSQPTASGPHAPQAISTPTSLTAVAPTATPDKTRIPYPWLMKRHQVPFSTKVVWVPTDARVYQELDKDFLAFWTWSGQAGPTTFPFSPDAAQIPLLATPDFRGTLQNYIAQIQSTGRGTAYIAPANTRSTPPIQTLKGCTQDGLQCQCIYVFARVTKIIYDANTGKTLSQTANLEVAVFANQSYNKEVQRWQLSNVTTQAIPA